MSYIFIQFNQDSDFNEIKNKVSNLEWSTITSEGITFCFMDDRGDSRIFTVKSFRGRLNLYKLHQSDQYRVYEITDVFDGNAEHSVIYDNSESEEKEMTKAVLLDMAPNVGLSMFNIEIQRNSPKLAVDKTIDFMKDYIKQIIKTI
jgi:hypothetical protein